MSKIHAYLKVELRQKSEGCYSIITLEKVYNHPQFNIIIANNSVEARLFKGKNFLSNNLFIFTVKYGADVIPLFSIELTDIIGGAMSLDQNARYDDEQFFRIFQYGFIKLGKEFNDAGLVRISDKQVLELFICRDGKRRSKELLRDFIAGKLDSEMKCFTDVWERNSLDGEYGDLPDISPYKEDEMEALNINLKPYKVSL